MATIKVHIRRNHIVDPPIERGEIPEDVEALLIIPDEDPRGEVDETILFGPPPTREEHARHHALVERILEKRKERRIAPLTAADLVWKARREEMGYAQGE